MTDGDDRIEARIRSAFLSEERRAALDLRLDPIVPRTRRQRGHTLGRLVAVAVVAVLAVSGVGLLAVSRGVSGPAGVPSVSAGPASGAPTATISATDRYDDGIPRTFDGQPVLRWPEALDMRRTATDSTPFLTGVWLDIPMGPFFCPNDPGPDPSAPDSWISNGGCQFNYVSGDAGAQATTQNGVTTFRFYKGALATGPVIIRVHLHDSRASQCGPQASTCDDMIVVDDIIWTGDAQTAPHPLTVDQVIAATRSASAASDLRASSVTGYYGCGAKLQDGLALCPPFVTGSSYASQIAGAVVLPSSVALARALPDVKPGVDGALAEAVKVTQGGSSGYWDYRWLVVDNVAILVRTAQGMPSQSDIDLLNRLQTALKALEPESSTASHS
jgi:hypothetical protein